MRRERSELENAVTTTPKGTIIVPTRSEMLMTLGAPAIGICRGLIERLHTQPGRSGRSKALRPSLFDRRDISGSGGLARPPDRGACS